MLSKSPVFYLYKFIIIIGIFGQCLSKITNISYFNNDYVPRVVNGWPGKLGDVPYQVAFKLRVTRNSNIYKVFCGGTIVGPQKIISAAHCFVQKKSDCLKLFIRVGTIHHKDLRHRYAVAGTLKNTGVKPEKDGTDEGQWRALREVRYPRNYKFPANDICIVSTTTPFVFDNHVNFIPYASRFADYRGKCLVSGYGRMSITINIQAEKLFLAHLELVPLATCSRQHKKNMRAFICTSSIITDVGKGDSGGPLACMNTSDPNEVKNKSILIGVVSGHHHGTGSFFTRVSSFYKFIERNACSKNLSNRLVIVLIVLIENPFLPF